MRSPVPLIIRREFCIRIQTFYRHYGICFVHIRICVSLYFRPFHWLQMIYHLCFSLFPIREASADVILDIQPEACILPFLRKDLLKDIFNYELPMADSVISMANSLFLDNIKRIKDGKFIIYFTEYGMTRFLQEGLFEEIPSTFYHPSDHRTTNSYSP